MGEINKVKAWFFYEEFKGSKRRWYKGYDVMISAGGHMTCGATLAETIYMAHDLIACITDDIVEVVAQATGFPVASVKVVAYEIPMFQYSEGPGISITEILQIVLPDYS